MGYKRLVQHYAFIGMSNHGKSWWAEQFATVLHFKLICIDALIEEKLKPILEAEGYGSGIGALAAWMGMPWDLRYAENQARYLQLEEQLTSEALLNLNPHIPTVIDTTGSVVHLSLQTQALLKAWTTVVFLDSTAEKRADARETYLANPKPVAFVHLWDPHPDETGMTTLKRCCANLQEYRDERYNRLADVIIPYQLHREAGWNAAGLYAYIGICEEVSERTERRK